MKKILPVCLLFFAVLVSYYSLALNNSPGLYGDDAGYVIWAKSMLNGGGLDYTNEPEPRKSGFVLYVLPALIAPLVYLTKKIAVYKIVPLIFSVFAIFLFLMYLKSKFVSYKLITVSLLLLIFNPLFFEYSHQIMAENIFIFLSLATAILAERYEKSLKIFDFNFIFLIILSVLSYFTRAAGITLIASVIVYFFIKSPKKTAAILCAYLIFFGIFGLVRNYGKPVEKEKYSSIILMKSQYEPEAGIRNIADVFKDASRKSLVYTMRLLPDMFIYPFFKNVKPSIRSLNFILQAASGLFIFILICAGLFFRLASYQKYSCFFFKNIVGKISNFSGLSGLIFNFKKNKTFFKNMEFPAVYIILTVLMLLIWQIYSSRYLLPLLPFIIFYFVSGAIKILNRKTFILCIILLLAFNIIGQFKIIYLERTGYLPDEWKFYYSTMDYIDFNSQKQINVICRKPLSYHIVSDYKLKTIGYPLSSNPEEIHNFVATNKINYIIRDNFAISGVNTASKYLDPYLNKYLNELELIYVSSDGITKLYKVLTQKLR